LNECRMGSLANTPFIRLLSHLGFRDVTLIYNSESINALEGRKGDELKIKLEYIVPYLLRAAG
jgi:hypothetical protein